MIERVNPPELGTPRGFSHAVVGSGKVVLLAGQTALNPEGRIVGDTVVEQFEQALGNLLASLSAAGGTPADLAYIAVNGTLAAINAAYKAGLQRVVLTSSSVVLGSSTHPTVRDDSKDREDPDAPAYVLAKAAQERAAFQRAGELGLELVAVDRGFARLVRHSA